MQREDKEFSDLLEVRFLLETQTAEMAAERRTVDDIVILKNAMQAFETKVLEDLSAIEENLFFHLKIADAAKNSTLKSLVLVVASKLLEAYKNHKKEEVCPADRCYNSITEHEQIFEHILSQEKELATLAMKNHLNNDKTII